MAKRVIISGGGTGGHIYPAIAIANALKELDSSIEILFVGAEGKMEMEKVPKAGYPIVGLPIVGIQRSFTLSNLAFPFKLINSLNKAREIIRNFNPDAAVGVGGFASGPLLMMAGLRGIPTLIQEQNSYAGVTNKLLARKAKSICVAYPGMEKFFPKEKIKLLGNPVRKDILELSGKRPEALRRFHLSAGKKTLFVMGGSLGAKSINESILSGLARIRSEGYQLIWQTGKPFIEAAKRGLSEVGFTDVFVSDFIYEMDLAYALADVVVSRAGALSVSELSLAKKPAILVPYPFASEDHQTQNALNLTRNDAALRIRDSDASSGLVPAALSLLKQDERQAILAEHIGKLGKPNAAIDIAKEVLAIT